MSHKSLKLMSCPVCNVAFLSSENLALHVLQCAEDNPKNGSAVGLLRTYLEIRFRNATNSTVSPKEFIRAFVEADRGARALMYVCVKCYTYGRGSSGPCSLVPDVCLKCEFENIMDAEEFYAKMFVRGR